MCTRLPRRSLGRRAGTSFRGTASRRTSPRSHSLIGLAMGSAPRAASGLGPALQGVGDRGQVVHRDQPAPPDDRAAVVIEPTPIKKFTDVAGSDFLLQLAAQGAGGLADDQSL